MTIHTDAAGLVAGEVTIPAAGGFALPAYRAMPAGDAPRPVILVASEIFGVHEHIADVCRRFAKLGYLAIAPEFFVRHGDAKAYDDIPKLVAEVVSHARNAQVNADLDATLAWAAGHGGDTSRLGITGFCWGGRVTWTYAAHQPLVKAGVAWYGKLAATHAPGDATPIELAASIAAPVLGLYGGADASIPLADVEAMRAALAAAGRTRSEIVVYPDSGHAFYADYRAGYRPGDAEDGWKRCVAWLRANGVG